MSARADRYWRSVTVVLTGTVAAQAIPLLGSLLLARLYTPADFGLFATWLGLTSFAAVVLTGRYEVALAIEADGISRRVAMIATLATVGLACLPLTVVGIIHWAIGLGAGVPAWTWWLGVPVAALIAASQTWQSWAAAEGQFRELSVLRVVQAAAITGLQVGVASWEASALSLAAAQLVGLAVAITVAARRLPLWHADLPRGTALQEAMRDFRRRRRRFPMLSLPADGLNTAAAQLPLLVVTSRFGAEVAGLLAMTMRTLGAPVALLGSAVLDVFRRRSAASFRAQGECRADYLQTLKVLSLGALAVSIPLGLLAEPLFALAFGERWRAAGTLALWLLPMFALRFVASPLSYMAYVAGKQHMDLVWQIALLAMTVATLTVPPDHVSALKAYSAGYSLMYCVYLVMSYRFSLGNRA
jgi:O-antigen/teichoic acid export membrane protein